MQILGSIVGKASAAVAPAQLELGELGGKQSDEDVERQKNREAIIQGLLGGRMEWACGFWSDLWFFLKQNHVLLGVFLCHSLHPYSRCKRGAVFLSNAVAGLGFALLLVNDDGTRASGAAAMAAGITVSILLAVGNIVQVQALTCSCVQEGSCCFKYGGKGVKEGAEGCGAWIGCFCWTWASFILLLGLLVGLARDVPLGTVLEAWLYGQVFSWLLGLAIAFLMFVWSYYGCFGGCTPDSCDGFCRMCCMGEAGGGGDKSSTSKYPHGPEYPKDKELLWAGDSCSCSCCA